MSPYASITPMHAPLDVQPLSVVIVLSQWQSDMRRVAMHLDSQDGVRGTGQLVLQMQGVLAHDPSVGLQTQQQRCGLRGHRTRQSKSKQNKSLLYKVRPVVRPHPNEEARLILIPPIDLRKIIDHSSYLLLNYARLISTVNSSLSTGKNHFPFRGLDLPLPGGAIR